MMNISSRFSFPLVTVAFLALFASCKDSGHSLGNLREPDARNGDAPVATGGATGAGGSTGTGGATAIGGSRSAVGGTTVGGSTSGGGAGGGAGGRGGTSTASDAGISGDTAGGPCADRGESCAARACCSGLICLSLTEPTTCYAPIRPTPDAEASEDTRVTSDTRCPVCDPMKCTYGSPIDSNGCTVCACNPPPDGGVDGSGGCALPEGCVDAAGTPDASTACPSTEPASGSTCVGQISCFYDVCPSAGRTQATCTAGKWVVETGACGQVSCQGNYATGPTCPSGQVCLAQIGGARLISCIANACGSGPASPDCTTFTAGCTPLFSLSSGVTYYCNTCTYGETCG